MKKILFAFIAIVLMSSFTLPQGKTTNPGLEIKLVKNEVTDEWEFVIHNKTKFHIDEFWVGEVKGDKVTWHHGHFEDDDTSIAPGETMELTVYDVTEGDYYLYTLDNVDHHNHLYKLHMDHDVDVDDSAELDEEDIEEIFGEKVAEDFEPEDDDSENDNK